MKQTAGMILIGDELLHAKRADRHLPHTVMSACSTSFCKCTLENKRDGLIAPDKYDAL
jgi:hypothetical protein